MKNNFKEFYEDEESIKMMNIINEEAEKEREKRKELYKQEKKQDRITMIFVIGSLLFILGCILYVSNKSYEKNVENCVNKGYTQTECEYEFSK